jgi:hypothetical protein
MVFNISVHCGIILVLPDGTPVSEEPHACIPPSLLWEIHDLVTIDGMTRKEAILHVRSKLVPDGYTPCTFVRNTPETFLHCLRSLVGTFLFRHLVEEYKKVGADFSLYLYIPEIDPVTKDVRHDRGDHNHVYKRIATSTRNGNCEALDYAAFDAVLRDPKSGLTHAALVGERKQSLADAERLLSYHVVDSLQRLGYETEAEYVKVSLKLLTAVEIVTSSQLSP